MNEQEKYYGRTPVVTAHMEARMKASREYAKMVSNDDETPAQRADRARAFECGAIWEEGTSKSGWHPASEPPMVPEHYNWISVIAIVCDMDDNSTRATNATFNKDKGWIFPEFSNVLYWCYPPKEE